MNQHVVAIWAEQERKNAELHKVDHSHIAALRIAERYRGKARGHAAPTTRRPDAANPLRTSR